MKKALSLALALVMAMAVAVPAFAVSTPAAETVPASVSDTEDDYGIMPLLDLYYKGNAEADDGLWPSRPFAAAYGCGNIIRFWHNNKTDHKVTVYLYRTDSGSEKQVGKPMVVPANDQKSQLYVALDADSGTYVVKIVSSEGKICGEVAVAQYPTLP